MRYYLIGAGGRLGLSIAEEYADSNIALLKRNTYEAWSQPGKADLVSRYFDQVISEGATIFVTSGLLDPRLPQEELVGVNYHLPKNLIDGAAKLGIKVITFGTVMEGFLHIKNPYVLSKSALGEYVCSVAAKGIPATHLQIHTLYGLGQPSPFMFLGQMVKAIQGNEPFKMTSGRQLREYHHYCDEAIAIRQIVGASRPGTLNLSHGKPLSLRNIAESVFQAFGRESLLRIGDLPEPPGENYETILKPTDIVSNVTFRDSLPAIVEYMKQCCARKEE